MHTPDPVDFEAFVQFCQAQSIDHIVVRETREVRPSYGEGHSVIVGLVHQGLLVAYARGIMARCILPGDALPDARHKLRALGIRLKEVSGNIT